jgi:hypothetical protein
MQRKEDANVFLIFAATRKVKPAKLRYEHIFQRRDIRVGAECWYEPAPCESFLIVFIAGQKENLNLKARFLDAEERFIGGGDRFKGELRIAFKLVAKDS